MAIERAHRHARRPAHRTVRGPRPRRAPARPGDGRPGCGRPGGLPRRALRRSRRRARTRRQSRARVARVAAARRRGRRAVGPAPGAAGRRDRCPGVLRLPRAVVADREPGRHGLEGRCADLAGAGPVDRHQHAPRPRGDRVHPGRRRARHRGTEAGASPPVAIVAGHRRHRRAGVPGRRDAVVSHHTRRGARACARGVASARANRSSPDRRRRGRPRPGVSREAGVRGPDAHARTAGRGRRPPDDPGVGCARPRTHVDVARHRAAGRRARRHRHRSTLGERDRRHRAGLRIAAGRRYRCGHRSRSSHPADAHHRPPAPLEVVLGSGRRLWTPDGGRQLVGHVARAVGSGHRAERPGHAAPRAGRPAGLGDRAAVPVPRNSGPSGPRFGTRRGAV